MNPLVFPWQQCGQERKMYLYYLCRITVVAALSCRTKGNGWGHQFSNWNLSLWQKSNLDWTSKCKVLGLLSTIVWANCNSCLCYYNYMIPLIHRSTKMAAVTVPTCSTHLCPVTCNKGSMYLDSTLWPLQSLSWFSVNFYASKSFSSFVYRRNENIKLSGKN